MIDLFSYRQVKRLWDNRYLIEVQGRRSALALTQSSYISYLGVDYKIRDIYELPTERYNYYLFVVKVSQIPSGDTEFDSVISQDTPALYR